MGVLGQLGEATDAVGGLARDGATSTSTANVELRRARKLVDMPATAAALVAGRVSMDHVDLLGRADQAHRHDLFVRDEEMLVEQCATLRHTQAVRAVEYWIQLADGETGDSTAPAETSASSVHASRTYRGTDTPRHPSVGAHPSVG